MSLLSPDPLRLEIGPHGVSLSRANAVMHAAAQPLSPDALVPVLEAIPSTPVLRRAGLSVTVDNAWVRWQVVDLPPGLSGAAEQQALVRARMAEVFGAAAQGWVFAWDAKPCEHMLACGMDAAIPQQLSGWAAARGLELVSVQPAWLRAYADFRGVAPLGGFAQMRNGWLCMGLWSGRRWLHVRGEALTDAAALAGVLERRLSLFDAAHDGGQLFVQGLSSVPLPRGWRCIPGGVTA